MKKKLCGIYCIVNKTNNKKYIGRSTDIINDRWMKHKKDLRAGNHHNIHLQRAWDKYGEESFEFIVLEETEESLPKREGFWINEYKTLNRHFGYNEQEIDVAGNIKLSEETKEKISISHRGENSVEAKFTWAEIKRIRSEYRTGECSQSELARKWGCTRSCIQAIVNTRSWKEEELQPIKRNFVQIPWNKGIFLSAAHKKKLSDNHANFSGEKHPFYGKHHSKEVKKRLSEMNSGENNPNFGKPRSEEAKRKIALAQRGEKAKTAKLTWEKVRQIRISYEEGTTKYRLAKIYGMSWAAIHKIINGETWKDIEKL